MVKVALKIAGCTLLFMSALAFGEDNMHRSVYTFESFSPECLALGIDPTEFSKISITSDMPNHFLKSLLPSIIHSRTMVINNPQAIEFVGESAHCQYRAYSQVPVTFGNEQREAVFFAITSTREGVRHCGHGGNAYIQFKTPLEKNCLITLKAVK